MSIYYKKSNSESTLELFNKSISYKARMIKEKNVVDFNIGERFLFGRVRSDSIPIVINDSTLKEIKQSDLVSPNKAANFVVDVFEDMALQFQKCANLGKIRDDDPFLSNLTAYRAYQPPTVVYENYKSIVFDVIAGIFKDKNIKVRNFNHFVIILKDIMKTITREMRITFPGFVKSRQCSILCSGLAIEIASGQNFTNNEDKISNFKESTNWNFYVNTCNSYGFMVDYNVPWRIVADIDSEIMAQSASKYGFVTTSDILSRGYSSAMGTYWLENFSKDLFELYNRVRVPQWNTVEKCMNGKIIQKTFKSKNYLYEQILQIFGGQNFLDLYLLFRLMEEKPDMKESDRQILIGDIKKLSLQTQDVSRVIFIFERIINKEFDKIGSFTYIRDAIKEMKQEAFSKGEIESISLGDV